MLTRPDRTASMSNDEMVVLQLLEEIHHLILPGPSGSPPSALRLHAAAKLYLDTRDTFEVIERNVEGHMQPDRPKFLRKLSKQRELNHTPRDSLTGPGGESAQHTPATTPQSTARSQVEEALASGTLTQPVSARSSSNPPSGRSSDAPADVVAAVSDLVPQNEAMIDRIQDMFRHLGEMLSRSILDEVRNRNLSMQSALHYVRFLPPDSQWTAYMERRDEEAKLAFGKPQQQQANETMLQMLKRNAEFIKEQIRKDVNTVCLFAPDGTLSTVFGDDITTDNGVVAEKFEVLIRVVYSKYLLSIVDAKMEQLLRLSDQWQQDMAIVGANPISADAPHAQMYVRSRKFRSKIPIFPHVITPIDERATVLPPALPGHQHRILVADLNHLGVWWQKSILAATDRDITTVHTDESRGLVGVNASLDGQLFIPLIYDNSHDFLRRYSRQTGLMKWLGHRILVNNAKDSLWVEVTVLEVEDKMCKLQLKKSLEGYPEIAGWQQLLASNEWIHIKDIKLCMVPLNPTFRIHMGLKFRTMLDVFHSLVTEISSIFPNGDLERRVSKSLWQAVEVSISRGEHVYARYFRSILNQELLPRRSVASFRRGSERPSIMSSSISVRNLVAALEHSASTQNGGSISAPSTSVSGAPSTPTAHPPMQRRLSLSASSAVIFSGQAVEAAYFDDKGAYHYQLQKPDMPLRINSVSSTISTFEKLAHHLLEEKEMIGACIQNNNIALGRAFAQVLQEKLTRLAKQTQQNLEQDDSGAIEAVITEYANASRFQYTWRIVRYELDTAAKQRRSKRDHANNIHAEWVDRCFHRMEALIATMLQLQLQHVQRVFFHECTRIVLTGVCEQDWTSSKPWFSNSRCTYALQFVLFRVQTLLESVVLKILAQYERTLGVHENLYDMAAWILVDFVACTSTVYEDVVVSRARLMQWKMDALYFVTSVHKLLRSLEKILGQQALNAQANGRGGLKKPIAEIRGRCLRLLTCVAIRSGPADAVIDEVTARIDLKSSIEHHVDTITELEVHVTALKAALGIHRQASNTLDKGETSRWFGHNAFGDQDLKHLAEVNLNWGSLISRSSMRPSAMLVCLRHRHELGDWEYPPLTDEQSRHRAQLQQCVSHIEARLGHFRDLEGVSPVPGPELNETRYDPRDSPSPPRSSSQHGPAVHGPGTQPQVLPNNPYPEATDVPSAERPVTSSLSSEKPVEAETVDEAIAPPPLPDSDHGGEAALVTT